MVAVVAPEQMDGAQVSRTYSNAPPGHHNGSCQRHLGGVAAAGLGTLEGGPHSPKKRIYGPVLHNYRINHISGNTSSKQK